MRVSLALEKVRSSFLELRGGLGQIVVGYPEFLDAIVVAILRRLFGMKGNILVYGPPGVAKTHTIKGAVNLIGQLNGGLTGHDGARGYVRVQGRSDLTPEDFISRRVAEYNDEGKLSFVDKLLAIERLRADNGSLLPGVLQFDELDKTPGRAVFGLLEVMEEQQVTLPSTGLSIILNTCVVAAANTKKFDQQAQTIPRAIQDRFSTVVFLDYLSINDDIKVLNLAGSGAKRALPTIQKIDMEAVRVLQEWVAQHGLPIAASEALKRGCVTAVKLTQKALPNFADFSRYIKTPSGPRGYIDLYQEAVVQAILAGSDVLQPEHCIQVGVRALRGRIEPAPEAELEDKTADTIIAEILQEVFGEMPKQAVETPAIPEEKDETSETEKSAEEAESEPEETGEQGQAEESEGESAGESTDEQAGEGADRESEEGEAGSSEDTGEDAGEESAAEPQSEDGDSNKSSDSMSDKEQDSSSSAQNDPERVASQPYGAGKQKEPQFGQPVDRSKQQQRKFLSGFRRQMRQKKSIVRQAPKQSSKDDAASQEPERPDQDEVSSQQEKSSDASNEAREDKQSGQETEKKGTDQVGEASSETSEDIHGGENASGEVEDSPNAKENGQQDGGSQQPGQEGDQPGSQSGDAGEGGSEGTGAEGPSGQKGQGPAGGSQSEGESGSTGEGSEGGQSQGSEGKTEAPGDGSGQGNSDSDGSAGADGDPTQLQQGGSGGGGATRDSADVAERMREVVDIETLAKLLAQKYATKLLKTKKGLETGAEIAKKLAEGGEEQKFDIRSEDGSLEAKVRGEKAIVEAKKETMEKLQEAEAENEPGKETGAADTGGAVAGKGESFPMMEVSNLPQELRSIMPALRELNAAGQIEKLKEWTSTPPENRSRMSVEYKLLKGIAHLNALKALRQFEEQTDGEATTSHAGERTDFLQGYRPDLPMDEERTVMNALESGGVLDDQSYVHEQRVTTDAPHFVFVIDTSGSMGEGKRMASALASATAICLHYGSRGATFGVLQFCDNPNAGCRPPESDTDRVIDAILMCSPSGGTSYAPALELASQLALPNTTVLCFGDFEDSSKLSNEALGLKKQKEIKVIGIVTDSGHPDYAAEICDEVNLVAMEDPTTVALVALEATQKRATA